MEGSIDKDRVSVPKLAQDYPDLSETQGESQQRLESILATDCGSEGESFWILSITVL